jgi:hypothetical protein
MSIRKCAAFAALVITLVAMVMVTGAPVHAQGWNHGGQHQQGGNWNHGQQGGGNWHQGGNNWHQGGNWAGAPKQASGVGWVHRDGYYHHSWRWYNAQPPAWRQAHPCYDTSTFGVYIKL